jgi:hypothetical protein
VSKSRAKRKQRQRARAASGGATGAAARDGATGAAARGDAKQPRDKPERATQADVRDGVARPRPIWAPVPLTEIGMAVGLVMFGLGFESHGAQATRLLTIGAGVLAVVVGEMCLREHLAGYRSHTLLLAAMPVAIAHLLVWALVTDSYVGPLALAVDVALAGALAWFLRARFRVAHDRALTTPP